MTLIDSLKVLSQILKVIFSSGHGQKINFIRIQRNYHQLFLGIDKWYVPNDSDRKLVIAE